MEGHGIRMMAEVFGGMIKKIIGCLVVPLGKEVQMDMLIWIMMEDVFQKYQNQKWTLWDGSNWNDAGYKDVKVRCGYKAKGK